MDNKTQYVHKENKGSLFRNDRKEKETQPDWKGEINVEGTLYWLSAWENQTSKGDTYYSVSVQDKKAAQDDGMAKARSAIQAPPSSDFENDDIPF